MRGNLGSGVWGDHGRGVRRGCQGRDRRQHDSGLQGALLAHGPRREVRPDLAGGWEVTPDEIAEKPKQLTVDVEALRELMESQLSDLKDETERDCALDLSELERRTLLECLQRLNLTPWEQAIYQRIKDA